MDPLTTAAAIGAIAGLGGAWQMRRRALRAEAQLRRMAEELRAERHAAGHDPLTGLLNRRTFHELGSALLASTGAGERVTAVVLDLDDFKLINDRLGHAAGDEVLVTVARRFAAYADGDPVARLGGDEFAGLIRGGSGDDGWLRQGARRLCVTLAAPMRITGALVSITASVGLVPVPHGLQLPDALRRADAEMYRAKARRRIAEPHRRGEIGPRHFQHQSRMLGHESVPACRPPSPAGASVVSHPAVRHLVDTTTTQSPDSGGS